MSDTDRRWFKRNPDANIRFRSAVADEAEHLLALVHPDFKMQLDQVLDKSRLQLSIAVLKLPHGKTARLPVAMDPEFVVGNDTVAFAMMCVGQQVVMG